MVSNWKSIGYLNHHMTDYATALRAMIAFCNHVISIYSHAHGIRLAKNASYGDCSRNPTFDLELQIDVNIPSFSNHQWIFDLQSIFDMFMLGYLAHVDNSQELDNFGNFRLVEAEDYWFWKKSEREL